MFRICLVIILFFLKGGNSFLSGSEKKFKIVQLSLEEAVDKVLKNNITIKKSIYEYIKADSPILKNQSNYMWNLYGLLESYKMVLPTNAGNVISGNKISQDKIVFGVEKKFQTGTSFKAETGAIRFDSNAFESSSTSALLQAYAIKPLYTGFASLSINQEIFKTGFYKVAKNETNILQRETNIRRKELENLLTQVALKVLVDYWTLKIFENTLVSLDKLKKNAETIRGITLKKYRLGISEEFEVHQWNSILYKLENQFTQAEFDRRLKERELVRILELDTNSTIVGVTDLIDSKPDFPVYEKELQFALENRIELKILNDQKDIVRLKLRNIQFQELPSVQLSATYSKLGQTIQSPTGSFVNTDDGVFSAKYSESSVKFKINYPIWDKGIQTEKRDLRLKLKEIYNLEKSIKLDIEEELKNQRELIETSYDVYLKSIDSKKNAEIFYENVLKKFQLGVLNALAVKQALDATIKSEMTEIQSKITYNIQLIRYDFMKNAFFHKYNIQVQDIIKENFQKK